MMYVHFTIPTRAVGKARPRFTKTGHAYTPQQTKDYERAVAHLAAQNMAGRPPLECPVRVRIAAMFEPPKSWSKKKREEAAQWQWPYDKKPDGDNLGKAVLDALNGIVFLDDKQVTELIVKKVYHSSDAVYVGVEAL